VITASLSLIKKKTWLNVMKTDTSRA